MADLKVLSDESDRPFWRRAWLVVGIALLCTLVGLIVWRGSGLIINVITAWFVALAMEPAVAKLSQRMRRGVATGVVMVIAVICVIAFILVFGNLFIDQLVSLIKAVPSITDDILTWWNKISGSSMSSDTLLKNLDLSNSDLAGYAQNVAGGLLGLIASIVSGFLGLFVLAFFAFYISASMPQLRIWCASRMKPHRQVPFLAAWDIMKIKVGGYMAARVVLAAINSACSAVAFYLIDLPYWLPLALWTGLVAQFVPKRRHLHLHHPAGHRRSHLRALDQRRVGTGVRVGLPAGREPHDRAEHLSEGGRSAPGGLVRGGGLRWPIVRRCRRPPRGADRSDLCGADRDLQDEVPGDRRDAGRGGFARGPGRRPGHRGTRSRRVVVG